MIRRMRQIQEKNVKTNDNISRDIFDMYASNSLRGDDVYNKNGEDSALPVGSPATI